MAGMFSSLSVRNYRIWFGGAFISNIGSWMQATAQSWVVLTELTNNNALAVGITSALQFGPQLILVPFSGMVADRFDRRKALLVTQSLLMLCSVSLGLLLISGIAHISHLYFFALLVGIINAFDTTLRQTIVSDLVGPDQITNAISLNAAQFNSARLIGPAVAGLLIAAIGSGWVFLVNGATFVAMLVSLFFLRLKKQKAPAGPREAQLRQMAEGFSYLKTRHDILMVLVIVLIVGALSMNFPVISSTMAVEFGHGADSYGVLSSMLAVGSLTGALLSARRAQARMRLVIIAVGGIAVVSALAAFAPSFWLFGGLMIFFGFAISTMLTTANGFVQTTSDPAVRGRVMALYLAVLMGSTPIGAPLVGVAADVFGARSTLVISAIGGLLAFVAGMVWLLTERKLRVHHTHGLHWEVTHAGRPTLDADRSAQLETLTAPLSVLKRDDKGMR